MPIISSAYGSDGSPGYTMSTNDPFLLVTSTGSVYGGEHTSGNTTYYYSAISGVGPSFGIDNAGQIFGFNYGINLDGAGQFVVNERSGSITAYLNYAVYIGGGTVTNYGTIHSDYYAIVVGPDQNYYSTVENFGTISGNIAFEGTAGAVFKGVGGVVYGNIQGSAGDDLFDLSSQTVTGTITGGGGADTVSFGEGGSGVIVDLVNGYATTATASFTLSGIDKVVGSNFADAITANSDGDVIAAGAGNDVVSGGAGSDTIDGGAGNDILVGDGGVDTVSYASAGSGVTVNLATTTAQATGGSGSDTLRGFTNLTGSNYDDVLTGDANANVIHGGYGKDVIAGGNGNNTIYGDDGNDTINGGDANNQLHGGNGDDKIVGGASGDMIEGDYGRDTLTGGGGADTFVYTYYSDSTVSDPDLITDFSSGADKIDISALHRTASDTFKISSSGGYTYIGVDYAGDGSIDALIKLTGTNVVKTTDVIWANAAFPAARPHALDHTTTTTTDHQHLAATLHAVTVDHAVFA